MFATKTIHLELIMDFTTESFLNCLSRFLSHRDRCRKIYLHNETNFVGAQSKLSNPRVFLRKLIYNFAIAILIGDLYYCTSHISVTCRKSYLNRRNVSHVWGIIHINGEISNINADRDFYEFLVITSHFT